MDSHSYWHTKLSSDWVAARFNSFIPTWLINVLLFLSHCSGEGGRERKRARASEREKERERERTIYVPSAPNWSRYVQRQFLDLKSTWPILSLRSLHTHTLSLSIGPSMQTHTLSLCSPMHTHTQTHSLFSSPNALFSVGWLYLCLIFFQEKKSSKPWNQKFPRISPATKNVLWTTC